MKENLFISFSGGRTSAFMTKWLLDNCQDRFNMKVVFANTGQEHEETLRFVQRCDEEFGLDLTWVEADVDPRKGKGTGFRIVDFESASREGRPFEEVIEKYGIPNQAYPHCTRELKLVPMTKYIQSIGWKRYKTAVGIRIDESHRVTTGYEEKGIVYPLIDMIPMTKEKINEWWRRQSFDLNLKSYEGNCKWCWKKSLRKHLTLINEQPEIYDFPRRMEEKHGLSGHNLDGTERVFFRGNLSTDDLFELAKRPFLKVSDENTPYQRDMLGDDSLENDESVELDLSAGCTESCEVYGTGTK